MKTNIKTVSTYGGSTALVVEVENEDCKVYAKVTSGSDLICVNPSFYYVTFGFEYRRVDEHGRVTEEGGNYIPQHLRGMKNALIEELKKVLSEKQIDLKNVLAYNDENHNFIPLNQM